MSAITTHILDTSTGKPAGGVPVTLEIRSQSSGWEVIGSGETDNEGQLNGLLTGGRVLVPGHYRLTYNTGIYFIAQEKESFYPQVIVTFTVRDASQVYHVPLLLSAYGYSTFRGVC